MIPLLIHLNCVIPEGHTVLWTKEQHFTGLSIILFRIKDIYIVLGNHFTVVLVWFKHFTPVLAWAPLPRSEWATVRSDHHWRRVSSFREWLKKTSWLDHSAGKRWRGLISSENFVRLCQKISASARQDEASTKANEEYFVLNAEETHKPASHCKAMLHTIF